LWLLLAVVVVFVAVEFELVDVVVVFVAHHELYKFINPIIG
jgi:hypothetical protein